MSSSERTTGHYFRLLAYEGILHLSTMREHAYHLSNRIQACIGILRR